MPKIGLTFTFDGLTGITETDNDFAVAGDTLTARLECRTDAEITAQHSDSARDSVSTLLTVHVA